MKIGDFVYCKKDFFNQNNGWLGYPEHPFHLGKKYEIYSLQEDYLDILFKTKKNEPRIISIKINNEYIEVFLRHEDFEDLIQTDLDIYDFDEYFFDNIKKFRKFKLDKIKAQ